jgi:hypothetical protein
LTDFGKTSIMHSSCAKWICKGGVSVPCVQAWVWVGNG